MFYQWTMQAEVGRVSSSGVRPPEARRFLRFASTDGNNDEERKSLRPV
jgi:hypothetical protein